MTVIYTKTMMPAFGFNPVHKDQYPITIMTVLSVNDQVGDCAAYHGVVPDYTGPYAQVNKEWCIDAVKRGGNKISEHEAKDLFPEIEENEWRYRP